jgi:nickel-dependent lactate racemase
MAAASTASVSVAEKTLRIEGETIDTAQIKACLEEWLKGLGYRPRKVLLLPPDITRSHSGAGLIVQLLWQMLTPGSEIQIMPALGTHVPMTRAEQIRMYGAEIPESAFLTHDWRNDTCRIGEIPSAFVREVSEGRVDFPIPIEVNKRLMSGQYDLIVSIGQVVPHEVVGMANYSKNIFVGCGGKEIIDKSHFLGAVYGLERLMGRDHSPVRKVFDYAEEHLLGDKIPLQYILTVVATGKGAPAAAAAHTSAADAAAGSAVEPASGAPAAVVPGLCGLYAGRERQLFEAAVRLSQEKNLCLLDAPLKKVVVYLDPEEFKSTWLGNKSVYRTRMAIADGGELLIIAPGLKHFGEDDQIDALIRKYGYAGANKVLEWVRTREDLGGNLSAAAHLIHGSSEGRFKITYAPGHVSAAEIEQVHFSYAPLDEMMRRYDPQKLQDGFNTMPDGEQIFFVSNPALGLWALREKF